MSVPVALEALRETIAGLPAGAFLLTAGPAGDVHVGSVSPSYDGGRLTMPAGRTARSHLGAHGRATVLWPRAGGGDYCLLVDGTASVDEAGELVVAPERAILHRLSSAGAGLPLCVPVDQPVAGS